LAVCLALVERQANGLLAQVDLERALLGQVITRQQAAQRPESFRGPGRVLAAGGRLAADDCGNDGDGDDRCGERPPFRQLLHVGSPSVALVIRGPTYEGRLSRTCAPPERTAPPRRL